MNTTLPGQNKFFNSLEHRRLEIPRLHHVKKKISNDTTLEFTIFYTYLITRVSGLGPYFEIAARCFHP
jgi:hypothetical protein